MLLLQGEDESDVSAPEMLTHHRGGHRRPQPRHMGPAYDVASHHRGGHRAAHRGIPEHYPQAALHMAHPRDQEEEEDSGASEADLLCSEVLSESHDEGSEAGSEEMYARQYYRASKVTPHTQSPSQEHPSLVSYSSYNFLLGKGQTCSQHIIGLLGNAHMGSASSCDQAWDLPCPKPWQSISTSK